MEILKFYHKEQRLIKCYMRKHLILLKVRNMVDINVNLHHLFIDFVIKKSVVTYMHTETGFNYGDQ